MLTLTTATFTSYNLVIIIKPSKTGLALNYITELTSEKDIYMHAKNNGRMSPLMLPKRWARSASKFPSKSFLSRESLHKIWLMICHRLGHSNFCYHFLDLQTAALCDQGHGELLSESEWILQGVTCVLKSNFLPCSVNNLTYSRDYEQSFSNQEWQVWCLVCI